MDVVVCRVVAINNCTARVNLMCVIGRGGVKSTLSPIEFTFG